MNAKATAVAIATSIAIVNAVVKRGEKVFNAYMIVSIRFDYCWLLVCRLARLGFSFCYSVVNRNEWGGSLPHRVMAALYAHKTKVSSFFLNFFFVGCGRVGVGAWVWALGWGGGGVGAGGWGRGGGGGGVGGGGVWAGGWGDGDGRARDGAGWIGIVAVGWTRIVPGLTQPEFGLAARV